MNERLKSIRKHLNMNQHDLGKHINLSRSHISSLENGFREVTDRIISDYCREFNVSEHWLRTGKGEMFVENNSAIIAELAGEYNLDAIDQKIIEHYINLDEQSRQLIKKEVVSLAEQITGLQEMSATNSIDEEVENYRAELESEKKGRISSASGDTSVKNKETS